MQFQKNIYLSKRQQVLSWKDNKMRAKENQRDTYLQIKYYQKIRNIKAK